MSPNGNNNTSKSPWLKWVMATVVGFLLGVGLLVFLNRQHIFHPQVEIDRKQYPVAGIDVSAHNGNVNFNKVKGDGFSFVFVKASEGSKYRDSLFRRNVTRAHEANLVVGAYHFFRKGRDGKAQALNFLAAVEGVTLDMPLVVDVEDWSNDNYVDSATVRKRLKDLIDRLHVSGRKVMIYTNGDGYEAYYKKGRYDQLPLWICALKQPSELKARATFQQYSHWGEVEGVEGDIDLNIFLGSMDDWRRWRACCLSNG